MVDGVLAVNEAARPGRWPDLTRGLARDPTVASARAGADAGPDRIEAEGLDFQRRVAAGFAALARRFPERVRPVDGSGSVEAVAAAVWAAVAETLAVAGLLSDA